MRQFTLRTLTAAQGHHLTVPGHLATSNPALRRKPVGGTEGVTGSQSPQEKSTHQACSAHHCHTGTDPHVRAGRSCQKSHSQSPYFTEGRHSEAHVSRLRLTAVGRADPARVMVGRWTVLQVLSTAVLPHPSSSKETEGPSGHLYTLAVHALMSHERKQHFVP